MVEPENTSDHKARDKFPLYTSSPSFSSDTIFNGTSNHLTSDIPFLVIQWLNNFANELSLQNNNGGSGDVEIGSLKSSSEKIKRLTNELSETFQRMGAFGTAAFYDPYSSFTNANRTEGARHVVSVDGNNFSITHYQKKASFKDISLRWSKHSGNQLEHVFTSAAQYFASGSSDFPSAAFGKDEPKKVADLFCRATLLKHAMQGHPGESYLLQWNDQMHHRLMFPSLLQPPPLPCNARSKYFESSTDRRQTQQSALGVPEHSSSHETTMPDNSRDIIMRAAVSSREHIECRSSILRQCANLRQMERSLESVSQTLQNQEIQSTRASTYPFPDKISMHKAGMLGIESVVASASRVFAHLSKKAPGERYEILTARKALNLRRNETLQNVKEAQLLLRYHSGPRAAVSPKWRFEPISTMVHEMTNRRDSSSAEPAEGLPKGRMNLNLLQAIQYRSAPVFNSKNSTNTNNCIQKQCFVRRLSRVVTINSHLFYPVYCLRFDRTGKYFVTGADDHLVKLFVMGDRSSSSQGRRSCFQRAPLFGATLVCTFRGHTGVITDIDVSVDNAMVATGSEDGDCRVWGLKDGSPIAVLRGHVGGVTMVSFALTIPYRLVTTAEDGYARVWDVRMAALKRYGRAVGQSQDYMMAIERHQTEEENVYDDINMKLDVLDNPSNLSVPSSSHIPSSMYSSLGRPRSALTLSFTRGSAVPQNGAALTEDIPLPPLPDTNSNARGSGSIIDPASSSQRGRSESGQQNQNGPIVPVAEGLNDNDDDVQALDEGVELLAKLPHGNTEAALPVAGGVNDPNNRVGTRNRRRTNKVICMARCPKGGHFATGTDDGVARIWQDVDNIYISSLHDINSKVATVVEKFVREQNDNAEKGKKENSSIPSPDAFRLLAKLGGHHNAITDLKYSHRGDRLLTASQKDGVVRIWSWDTRQEFSNDSCWSQVKQLIIPLVFTKNGRTVTTNRFSRPAKETSRATGPVQCDVAVWSADDLYVITSQSIPTKQSGSADPFQPLTALPIVPQSQILQLWDSITGSCLIRVEGAHAAPCNVIMPHPTDSSLMVSAGSDGVAHLWDIFEATRLETWENRLSHGALPDPRVKNKLCGFCDGCWRDDGQSLVLTDDCGRLTLMDISGGQHLRKCSTAPSWMEEQYFASDYYELTYDSHGYALDSRSNLPPHMAPRAVRCNHIGVSIDDGTNYSLSGLTGPGPIAQEIVEEGRKDMIRGALELRHQQTTLGDGTEMFDCFSYQTMFSANRPVTIGKADGAFTVKGPVASSEAAVDDLGTGAENSRQSSSTRDRRRPERMLSARFIYREDDGAVSSDGDDDAEEEDFVPTERVAHPGSRNSREQPDRMDVESDGSESASLVDSDDSGEQRHDNRVNRGIRRRQISEADSSRMSAVDSSRRSGVVSSRRSGGDDNRRIVADTIRTRRSGVARTERRSLDGSERPTRRAPSNRSENAGSAIAPPPRRNERNANLGARRNERNANLGPRMNERNANLGAILGPRRASGRPRAPRPARYAYSSESEDENNEYTELLSPNRAPVSEDDYNGNYFHDIEQGHIWKIARQRKIKRDWLLREESRTGFSGLKSYAPQVGDSVVYIPRANYETILKHPVALMHTAPWKKFPRDLRWPVLLCSVVDVRYRFPVEGVLKNYNAVNAIVRLQISGVPKTRSKDEFLWSSPEFIDPPFTDKEFDVTLTQVEGPSEYLVPEGLYLWRIMSLEAAITLNQGAPGVGIRVSYGSNKTGVEDSIVTSYDTQISSVSDDNSKHERHFEQSGFSTIFVSWSPTDKEWFSPWDVDTLSSPLGDMPEPPVLSEMVQIALIKKLDQLLREDQKLKDFFLFPVNREVYSDYDMMIEVPMDLDTVQKRLKNRYYSTTGSFLADIKLIENNCRKYNDQLADVVQAAEELTSYFTEAVREIDMEFGNKESNDHGKRRSWEMLQKRYLALDFEGKLPSSNSLLAQSTEQNATTEDFPGAEMNGPTTSRFFKKNASSENAQRQKTSDKDFSRNRAQGSGCVLSSLKVEAHDSEVKGCIIQGENQFCHNNGDSLGCDALRPKKIIPLSDRSHALDSESEQFSIRKPEYEEGGRNERKRIRDDSEEESTSSDGHRKRESTKRRRIPKDVSLATSGIDLSLSQNDDANEQKPDSSSDEHEKSEHEELTSHDEEDDEKNRSTQANNGGVSGRRTLRIRLRAQQPRRANLRTRNNASASESENPSSTNSNDEEESLPSSDSAESEFADSPPKRKNTRKRAQPLRRVVPKRGQRKTYKSESESFSDNASSDEPSPPAKRPTRAKQIAKSQRRPLRNGRGQSKDESDYESAESGSSSEQSGSGSKESGEENEDIASLGRMPRVLEWPHISPHDLFLKVCRRVLRELSALDTQKLFATPVIKTYPKMKKEYLKKISTPMDFSTVRNKFDKYYSMMDFRNDLILTFKNCVLYNGFNHEYGVYARSIWRQLDKVFQSACEAEGVSSDYIRSPQKKNR